MSNMLSLEYSAGFFDGEGCVDIYKNKGGLHLQVTVANTNEDVLRKLQLQFGGNVYFYARVKSHYKDLYRWRLAGPMAARFLSEVLPFLIIKRNEALVGLEFQARKKMTGARGHSSEEHAIREGLQARIRGLRRVA